MRFSVIYSVDVPAGEDVDAYAPPGPSPWDQTEGDEGYEYGYLEGRWEDGHHRKWAGVLDRDQFNRFVRHCSLTAEDVRTMGSLGTPGCGYGWAPAISFRSDDPDAITNAYVTPLPQARKDGFDDRDWERVRAAVLAVYG
jgi:hypothetical protein